MHRCRMKREFKEGTWISDEMEAAYCRLFQAGYAVSGENLILRTSLPTACPSRQLPLSYMNQGHTL